MKSGDVSPLSSSQSKSTFHLRLPVKALQPIHVLFVVLCLLQGLSACVTTRQSLSASGTEAVIPVHSNQPWQLSDLVNETGATTASGTIKALLQTHLKMRGVSSVNVSQQSPALIVKGEVVQWHYLQGAVSRPYIELRIDVQDPSRNMIIRTDLVSDTGSRSESLTMLADRLLADYVKALPLQRRSGSITGQVASEADANRQTMEDALPAVATASLGMRGSRQPMVGAELFDSLQGADALAGRSVAFYYGDNPAINELSQFDRIILEPDNIKAPVLAKLTEHGASAYAYLSVGEVGRYRAYAAQMDPAWIIGSNEVWQSAVLDLSNPELRGFLVRRVGDLARQGYNGIFLDTMDSFNIVAKTPEQREQQRAGLVSLIAEFANAHPQLGLVANRGFEVLDEISMHLDAVVAESLYSGWNNVQQRYEPVTDNDRSWLLSKLDHAADKLNLDVIVVDYVAPSEREKARHVARQIAGHGFIPWVANPELDYLGIGAMEVVPRKVLMLFDGAQEGVMKNSFVHRYVAMPIEYLGYVPEYLDVSSTSLPEGVLKGRYAGIVTWAQERFTAPQFRPWLLRHMRDRLPVAFLGSLPLSMDSSLAELMGVSSGAELDTRSVKLAFSDDMIKPERSLSTRVDNINEILNNQRTDSQIHMRYRDARGSVADVVVTGGFGGYALNPGVFQHDLDSSAYWVVDPFRFIETALQLPRVPQPDVTTENGRRLWLAHIDGDALPSWAEMPGRRLGAEVIHDQILTQYRLPHTVSVVEGEMTEDERVSDRREQMFDVARRMFELDHVELASHTYSHPFFWAELGRYRLSGKYNLSIPGYVFNAEREVAGSIDFINQNLAPPGKKAEVMLWSGDAFPREEDLAVANRLGLVNMNGGFTAITRDMPTMTRVTAMARPVGAQLQVYAPIMNENVYTDSWRGPFDGFRDVIDTFQMTDEPRRLKPINIYYHFYSGTKIAAMRALQEVYAWSTAQDIFPVYVSDYARKVPDFRDAGVARYLDGHWKLTRLGNVRSLRVLGDATYPQFTGSQGISGARRLHDGVYFHTDGSDEVMFRTSAMPDRYPHLVSSNGRVRYWRASGGELSFRISGEIPVSLMLGGSLVSTCALDTDAGVLRGVAQADGFLRFTFTEKDTGNVTLNCPA